MPPTDEEVIDLTISDDEDDNEPDSRRKRPRYNDDDEVVIVEGDAAVPKPSEPETGNDIGDDEVKLVSSHGVEDWTSLPHTRDLCRQCPFKLGMQTSNAKYCARCFCYICDCPASECKEWGTGAARTHHCNATAKSITYRTQRQEHLKQNRAARATGAGGSGIVNGAGTSNAAGGPRTGVAFDIAALHREMQTLGQVRDSLREQAARSIAPLPSTGRVPAPTTSAGSDSSLPPSSDNESEECNCPNCRRRRGEYDDDLGFGHMDYGYDGEDLARPSYYDRMTAITKKNEAPKKCTAKEMSDPLLDPNMIELTTFTFQVEALGTNKISDLKRRLGPHGFYENPPSMPPNEMGDKLTLRTLIEERRQEPGQYHPYLKLSPITRTPPPFEPSPHRVIPIIVHFWDGRAPPTKYGVAVTPGTATIESMLKQLREMLELDSAIYLDFAQNLPRASADAKQTITDDWLDRIVFNSSSSNHLSAYCVPSVTPDISQPSFLLKPLNPSGPAFKRPTMALVFIHWEMPFASNGSNVPKLPNIYLPLRSQDLTGGLSACEEVARNVIAALRPYRNHPEDESETRRLVTSLKRRISWGPRGTYGAPIPFDTNQELNRIHNTHCISLGVEKTKWLRLTAAFSATDLDAFNTILWKEPAIVDPSAAADAIDPTVEYFKAIKEVRAANDVEDKLPIRVLKEVQDASTMSDPAVVLPPATAALYEYSALARYKAELTPTVEESIKGKRIIKTVNEKKGILKVRVFVFRTRARNCVGFFDQGNDWGAAATQGRPRGNRDRSIIPHKLNLTLWYHLKENSQFIAHEEHRKHWAEKDGILAARRSITALMEVMERPEAPTTVQPRGLTVTLRPYQLQSLKFMLDAENCDGGFRKHLWVQVAAADGTPFWYSPLLGRVASEVPAQASGGFCCEEMGLGKTVEVLALCLANPAPPVPAPETLLPNRKLRSRATLVVCAVSLVGQWMSEAEEKTAGSLKIHMYHGPGRIKDARRLATEFDLVITTYATLSADCGKMNNPRARAANGGAATSKKDSFTTNYSPLHGVQWHRLVLDESHTCKNPVVGHTKACVALEAQRRWMCTGTPINTDVQDLFGQFAVLGFAPFNNRNFFDSNVKNAFGNNVYGGGCPELLHALGAIMVRHTKRQELGGEQVLQLPPKTEELVPVILTADEQAVYRRVHATAAEYFSRYEVRGPQFVSKHLLHIMSLLLPMRRICSGGALLERDLTVSEPEISAMQAPMPPEPGNNSSAAAELKVDESLVAPDGEECPICMDAYEEPAVTTCSHWYCKACIVSVLQTMHSRCPLCRGPQRVNQLRCGITAAEAAERNAENEDTDAAQIASQGAADVAAAERLAEREAAIVSIGDGVISESKLAALLKSLRAMRRGDSSAKALIFSQYNSTIEWLKGRLTREGFGYRHISGSMPLKQRAKAIAAFQGDPPTTVFLLSMRSGAVGINLTAASHVYLLEPALNPALEDQAVGRAWRMGQRREVKVVRFYVKGSVEEQIMEVVKTRQNGVAGAAAANANDGNGGASGSGGAGPSRIMYDSDEERMRQRYRPHIRVEDQAGSIKEDKQNLRLSELQALFKAPEFPEPRNEEASSEEEDEAMPNAAAAWEDEEDEIDYAAVYQRNNNRAQQQQQQRQAMVVDNEAGTSAMHAAMGVGHKSAAVMKNRMRRSKAGIASVAAVAAPPAATAAAVAATPGGAAVFNTDNQAGPSNPSSDAAANGNGTSAANGVTPAATLQAAPATGARQPAPATAAPGTAVQEEEEEVVEMAPAAILQRIKLLAQRATGRLTPAANGALGTQRAGAVGAATKTAKAVDLADEPDTEDDEDEELLEKLLKERSPEEKSKKRRGRPPSRNSNGVDSGANTEAITAHIPNPTPDASASAAGASNGGGASGGENGRPSRRGSRLNYAVLANQGADAEDVIAATTAV